MNRLLLSVAVLVLLGLVVFQFIILWESASSLLDRIGLQIGDAFYAMGGMILVLVFLLWLLKKSRP